MNNIFPLDMNIDNLLNGLDAKDKDLFKREFAKEAKKYGELFYFLRFPC